MKINEESCVGCGLCLWYCPMEAIHICEKKAVIDREECVECGVCFRSGICSKAAIEREELHWPRSIRAVYSDPLNIHKDTNMAGRGTSEMKTNDVTGRFQDGELGIALETGRPGVGTRIREIELLTKALVRKKIKLEPLNPFTKLVNPDTGEIDEAILDEKVMSVVLEFSIPEEKLLEILNLIRELEPKLNTVVSVGLVIRSRAGAFDHITRFLDENHIFHRPNGKLNVGMGKLQMD